MPPPSQRQTRLLDEARRHFENGDLEAAERIGRQLLSKQKRDPNAWQLLGLIANRRGWFDQAVPCFQKCVQLRPEDPMSHCRLAKARMSQGRFEDALEGFDAALKLKANFPPAVRGKAELLERSGRIQDGFDLLAPVAERHPTDAETNLLYASLHVKTGDPEQAVSIGRRLLALPGVQPNTRRQLCFVIGKAHDRLKQYDSAFEAYRTGNALASGPFDIAQKRHRVDRLIEIFSAESFQMMPRAAEKSELPVFIVGMPRSGSTLVEQIIDAHPRARGAGELTAFNELMAGIPKKIGSTKSYPDWIADLRPGVIDRLGRPYLEHLSKPDRSAERVADKNLLNYNHLGLISLLYPTARIIHCRRDPLDNLISCYINNLSPVGFPWSTDLVSMGLYYREYDRLVRHWLAVVDLPVLDLSYEALVDDQERFSREIIEFCGLDWDDACLEFYKTGRAVTTLSYDQVRQPIYRTALKRAARYEKHLGPLREALAGNEDAARAST